MEGVERVAEFFHKLERHADAVLSVFDRVRPVFPGADGATGAKGIGASAAERVPIDDAEPEVVLHRLAADLFVGVVMMERERVLGIGTFVADAFNLRECGHNELP